MRALILAVVIAAPSFILLDIPDVARELSMIIAAIIAAFALFEYASKSPGFVDFRFAPPYNRFRVGILAGLAIGLSLLVRASLTENTDILALADWTLTYTITPNSPVDFALAKIMDFETSSSAELLTRVFSAAFAISVGLTAIMSLLLWVFKWPFGRTTFNLWANLPTFAPAEVSLTGRRLRRDGRLNVLLSLALFYITPFSFPLVQDKLGPDLFGNSHSLIWVVTVWAFLPSLMFIRGISLIKIARILSKAIMAK
ncbi:MAG: hypothetical protein COB08_007880 [Rhodobacteraceae bacterium]|nr:hypothetical protein [Paracoccaceae bacterium]